MKTYFDIKNNKWNLSASSYVPRHDLYFGTPRNKPTAGIPIGDGDTGSLIWLEKDGIHINIGKCDLWQDAPKGVRPGEDWYNTNNEELHTLNKHGGEIVIRLESPMFDYMYQSSFCHRLSLSDGSCRFDNSTPFGSVCFKAFASARERVSIFDISLSSSEEASPEIILKRWGSRTMWRWYYQQRFAPEIGLEGTECFVEDNCIFITQDISTTKFCLGVKLQSDTPSERKCRHNSHQGSISLKRENQHNFTLYYAIRISDTTEKARLNCKKALENAQLRGKTEIYNEHKNDWEKFWNTSFVSIDDDYIENHIYLYMYYMNSASKGSYPMHFIQGPWGFYHDYVPWNYYFHYNMQHLYAPLDALGHGELAENYYDMRLQGLKTAKLYAENVKGKKGAFYHDVTDRYGRGADYSSDNHSVGAQVAMQLYFHYKYTDDREFLNKYALPVMKETAIYYLDMLRKGEDGLHHIHDTCGYEGTYLMDDTLSDIVMIKALFGAYLPYSEGELKDKISDALSHLPDYSFTSMLIGDDWDGEKFLYGYKKGEVPSENGLVFAIGKNKDGSLQRRHCGSNKELLPEGECVFPYVEFSPLYPAGILGLKDKGTKAYNVMENQLGLMEVPLNGGMQWNLMPVFFARMGKGEEMYQTIRGNLNNFQAYPNGFNAEESEPGCKPPFEAPQWYRPYNTNTNKRFMLSPEDFTHFDFETTPVLTMAVIQSLLQSHEGIIRIFPATPQKHNAVFSLFAEGGFRVTAQLSSVGIVATIERTREGSCLIALPEKYMMGTLYAYEKSDEGDFKENPLNYLNKGNERLLDFSHTLVGSTVLISSCESHILEIMPQREEKPNMAMKLSDKAHLGTPELMHDN